MIVQDFSDGAPEAVSALMDYAENDASAPEMTMIASSVLACEGQPMIMTLTIMGLFVLLGERIPGGAAHLDTIASGFRGALEADIARHGGASG